MRYSSMLRMFAMTLVSVLIGLWFPLGMSGRQTKVSAMQSVQTFNPPTFRFSFSGPESPPLGVAATLNVAAGGGGAGSPPTSTTPYWYRLPPGHAPIDWYYLETVSNSDASAGSS